MRNAKAAGNTSDVDVDQELLAGSASGNSLPDVAIPDIPLPTVVSEESTSPRIAEEAMVVVFGLGSGSCPFRFLCCKLSIPGVKYYTRREVFESLRVHVIHSMMRHLACRLFATPGI
jgi:hypothetical protein